MTDDELEELRQQTRGTDRIDADEEPDAGDAGEPASESGAKEDTSNQAEADAPEPDDDFAERFAGVVGEVRRRERPRSFSASDAALSAFFETLSRDEDARREVGEALERRADVDVDTSDGYTKSELVRLSVLAGVRDAAPGYFEDVRGSVDQNQG